jgi:hypothetical protein
VCSANEIPLIKADGSIDSCQSAAAACPSSFPVTVRENAQGLRTMCLTLGASCPSGYKFAAYGLLSTGSSALTVTNCYKNGAVTSCALLKIPVNEGPPGSGGDYSISVTSNATGSEQLLGCVVNTATVCPAQASFTWLSFNTQTQATVIEKCSPASEVVRCSISSYPTPGYTASTLTSCIKGITGAGSATTVK